MMASGDLHEPGSARGVAKSPTPLAPGDRVIASPDHQDGPRQFGVPSLGRVFDHVPRLLQVPLDAAAEIVREHDQVDERRLPEGVERECPGLSHEAAMALIDDGTDRYDGLHAVRAMESSLDHPLRAHGVPDDDDVLLAQRGDHLRECPSHPQHVGIAGGPGQPRESRQVHGHDTSEISELGVQPRQVAMGHADAVHEHDRRCTRRRWPRTVPDLERHPVDDDATTG